MEVVFFVGGFLVITVPVLLGSALGYTLITGQAPSWRKGFAAALLSIPVQYLLGSYALKGMGPINEFVGGGAVIFLFGFVVGAAIGAALSILPLWLLLAWRPVDALTGAALVLAPCLLMASLKREAQEIPRPEKQLHLLFVDQAGKPVPAVQFVVNSSTRSHKEPRFFRADQQGRALVVGDMTEMVVQNVRAPGMVFWHQESDWGYQVESGFYTSLEFSHVGDRPHVEDTSPEHPYVVRGWRASPDDLAERLLQYQISLEFPRDDRWHVFTLDPLKLQGAEEYWPERESLVESPADQGGGLSVAFYCPPKARDERGYLRRHCNVRLVSRGGVLITDDPYLLRIPRDPMPGEAAESLEVGDDLTAYFQADGLAGAMKIHNRTGYCRDDEQNFCMNLRMRVNLMGGPGLARISTLAFVLSSGESLLKPLSELYRDELDRWLELQYATVPLFRPHADPVHLPAVFM